MSKIVVLTDEAFSELNSKLNTLIEDSQKKQSQTKEWLTNEEVMKLLDVSKSTLQSYRDKMQISFYQIGRKILYKPSDVSNFLENYRIQKVKL